MWGPKIVLLWCSDWLKIVILWHSIACKSEIYAAQCRSLLQEEAAAEDASRAAVHVESCDTMCSRKAQCQAPPGNTQNEDTYHSRKRSYAAEQKDHQNVHRRHSSSSSPTTTATTTHTRASNVILGGTCTTCRLDVVAAAAACCSYCGNEPAPAERGTGYHKGVVSRNLRPAASWHASRLVHVSFGRVLFTDCESCTGPISTNLGSTEAVEHGLKRRTCFVARDFEVVAVAGLLRISWWVLGAAGFRVFFLSFFFRTPMDSCKNEGALPHLHLY